MTRNQIPASPTNRPRAWSALAALLLSMMLAPTAAFADAQAPAAPAATEQHAPAANAPAAAPAATDPVQAVDAADVPEVLEADNSLGMAHDLSPWGMYQNADIIVKIVMIGLAIASIITWTIWIAKGFELMGQWLGSTRLQVATTSVGRGQRVLEMATQWAATRKQFGQAIGKFQGPDIGDQPGAANAHLDLAADLAGRDDNRISTIA